ncbi:MAG: hypothetical protein NWR72_00250, partial [Bacteroidia bacterium]|nr:hypothetical protein [Bacteroidia bacterium]
MKKNWDMSNWEEHIRAEILLGKARSPQPNWEKMAGILDANADRNRRRRLWLLAACFGGLLLLGAGFLAAPQRDLIRQYAFKMRAAESGSPAPNLSPQGLSPQQSESGTVLEQGAPAS